LSFTGELTHRARCGQCISGNNPHRIVTEIGMSGEGVDPTARLFRGRQLWLARHGANNRR
jgi:hypothetical protein